MKPKKLAIEKKPKSASYPKTLASLLLLTTIFVAGSVLISKHWMERMSCPGRGFLSVRSVTSADSAFWHGWGMPT